MRELKFVCSNLNIFLTCCSFIVLMVAYFDSRNQKTVFSSPLLSFSVKQITRLSLCSSKTHEETECDWVLIDIGAT